MRSPACAPPSTVLYRGVRDGGRRRGVRNARLELMADLRDLSFTSRISRRSFLKRSSIEMAKKQCSDVKIEKTATKEGQHAVRTASKKKSAKPTNRGEAREGREKKRTCTCSAARPTATGSMKPLLGGKGANLAEMCRIGLPVPPGFTITTEVCTYYYANKRTPPAALRSQVEGPRAAPLPCLPSRSAPRHTTQVVARIPPVRSCR